MSMSNEKWFGTTTSNILSTNQISNELFQKIFFMNFVSYGINQYFLQEGGWGKTVGLF